MKGHLSPRAEELLVERALRPLDDKELKELDQLRAANDESFDVAAAAIAISATAIEPMPEHLADKILGAVPADFKRTTLPGVLVPTPELSHDTMIGVDPRQLDDIDIDAPTVLAGGRNSTDREVVVGPLPSESLPVVSIPPKKEGGTLPPPQIQKAPALAAAKLPQRNTPPSKPPVVSTDRIPDRGSTPPPMSMAERLRAELRSSSEKRAAVAEQTPVPTRLEPVTGTTPPVSQTLPPRVVLKKPSTPPASQPLPSDTIAETVARDLVAEPNTVTTTTREARVVTAQPRPTTNTPFPPGLEITSITSVTPRLPGEVPPMKTAMIDLTGRTSVKYPVVRRRSIVPWIAAAAGLLLAAGAVTWAVTRDKSGPVAAIDSPERDRSQFLANAIDISKITWTPTNDPTARSGATGDVVWSPSQQRGYMRFVGLQVNDPAKFQYQLWIFDRNRDQAYPIDGGVFDVSSTGEVIVAIKPKLHVDDATLFAVTVEKPGGVVVSKRERIVVTAARS